MKNMRAGETRHYPFRSERLYSSNSAWYFMVRGGDSRGPFDDREAAHKQLDKYITTQQRLNRAFLDRGPG